MLTLTHLRCEYAVNPLGIDAAQPRLSWIISAVGRNHRQTAYQVVAASSLEDLAAANPDRWDSGKVESTTNLVAYAGRPLNSGECCWWKARVWDENDEVGPFSEPAWFEMGLLSPADWTADWIGYPGAWPGKALYFRRDFRLEKSVRRARVYMVGLGWSEMHINGHKVHDRVLDPPQSNYSRRVYYSTDPVESFLQPGANTIGVICGNGWFGTVRLLLQMQLEYSDGTSERIVTETCHPSPWLVKTGPILENSVYDGETYDARLEEPGWDSPSTSWKQALVAACADGPAGKRVAADLEPIRVVQTLPVKSMSQPKPGVYVFDLGQNIAGWVRFRISGPAGTPIVIRHAESLYPDGTLNQENLRNARAEDRYILNGTGTETWEPRFTYHGFRYFQVEGWPGAPDPAAFEGRVVRSAVSESGSFQSSNELLNRIHVMVRWTEAGNLHSLPTDCPQRDERMGWLNDMAARTEEALYNFDMVRLLSKWVADIADEQDPNSGAITDTAPYRWGRRPADPVSVCYLLIPWLLYVHYGDRHTMAERYEGMKAWVDYLTSRTSSHIVQYSYYGDWAPPIQFGVKGSQGSSAVSANTPGKLVSTACYAYSARLLAQMAELLGKSEDWESYSALVEAITRSYNTEFWDEDAGGYGTNNQSCNAISYYMGLVPAGRRARVIANLVDNVTRLHDGHLTTGNICTKYLLEALTSSGQAETAYRIAAQETYPSWGFMLANGATTLWERWEHATGGGMNSHNHPMLGSVGAWLYRAIAGIQADPGFPGFERFDIRPNLVSGVSSAQASLETVRGKITCSWQMMNGTLNLDISVPAGCRARVHLQLPVGSTAREGETVLWQDEQPASMLMDGILIHRKEGDLLCQVGSGEYHFTATLPPLAVDSITRSHEQISDG